MRREKDDGEEKMGTIKYMQAQCDITYIYYPLPSSLSPNLASIFHPSPPSSLPSSLSSSFILPTPHLSLFSSHLSLSSIHPTPTSSLFPSLHFSLISCLHISPSPPILPFPSLSLSHIMVGHAHSCTYLPPLLLDLLLASIDSVDCKTQSGSPR